MRIISKLITGVAAAGAVVALAGPAWADPPSGVTPKPADIAGVGSDTIQNVMDQFSHDFSKTVTGSGSKLHSGDATNPKTGAIHDSIKTKSGCAAIPRPDGSSEGILALDTENKTTSGLASLRWSPWPAYLATAPLALAVLWNLYQSLAALLPNLY